MLSDTTYLGFRPMLLYFLPQLSDFRTTNTFMSCRHWLTSFTLAPSIILSKNPRKFRLKKVSVAFFLIVPLFYWIFMSNTNKSHSKLNTSLSFRDGRIAVDMFCIVFVRIASVNTTRLILLRTCPRLS